MRSGAASTPGSGQGSGGFWCRYLLRFRKVPLQIPREVLEGSCEDTCWGSEGFYAVLGGSGANTKWRRGIGFGICLGSTMTLRTWLHPWSGAPTCQQGIDSKHGLNRSIKYVRFVRDKTSYDAPSFHDPVRAQLDGRAPHTSSPLAKRRQRTCAGGYTPQGSLAHRWQVMSGPLLLEPGRVRQRDLRSPGVASNTGI